MTGNPLELAARPLLHVVQRRSARLLRTRHVDLRRHGLDLGLRIVLASDVHARDDWFPRRWVATMVDTINAVEGADLVTLVGDFVGDDATAIDWSAEEYARIEAPLYATLGNHDHWTDAKRVARALVDAGAMLLTNEARDLGGGRWVAGLDSCWTRDAPGTGPDVERALADVPADARCVVLGHEPHLATLHEEVLHLAGHTHCGQIRLPLGRLGDHLARLHMPRFSEPWPARLHRVRRGDGSWRWIYTTAGVGYSTVDLRICCPPEIVVVDC